MEGEVEVASVLEPPVPIIVAPVERFNRSFEWLAGVDLEVVFSQRPSLMKSVPASQYLWTDDCGNTHVIHQGEGGEQGDALMPMLYALGQHGALLSLQDFLLPAEHLFAYLDDMYVVCLPDRAGSIFKHLQEALEQYARIQVHLVKTQVWNRGGHVPPACVEMQAATDRANPQSQARIWRGAGLPSQQGIRALGIPIGHEEYVQAELRATTEKHSILLDRFLWSRTFRVLGCSSCSARTYVPRIPFARFHLQKLNSSHSHTTLPRGGVSRDSWASQVSERRRTGPVCHSRWEDVVCGAPLEFGSQPTGLVGQTVSGSSTHVTQELLPLWSGAWLVHGFQTFQRRCIVSGCSSGVGFRRS